MGKPMQADGVRHNAPVKQRIRGFMVEVQAKDGDSKLAGELLFYFEALANLHYLLDLHVANAERLRELRDMEDDIFKAMLKHVLGHLSSADENLAQKLTRL